jgi:hypothetical protein
MKKLSLIVVLFVNFGFGQNYFIPQYKNDKSEKKSSVIIENVKNLTQTYSSRLVQINKGSKDSLRTNTDSLDTNFLLQLKDINELVYSNDKNSEKSKLIINIDSKTVDYNSVSELKKIRDQFTEKNTDDEYKTINKTIEKLKIANTESLLLTKIRKPKLFNLFNAEEYDYNTFNNYLSGQKNIAVFKNASVQTFNQTTYINAEFISFYFGYVRLGVTGSLKATNNKKNDTEALADNLTKILHNSGSFSLNFSVPIFFNRDRNDHIHYGIFAESSVGFTPNFDAKNSDAYFSSDLLVINQSGLNFKFDISSNEKEEDKKARFVVELPLHYSFGNKKSYELLGIGDNTTMQLNLGVVLGDRMSFSISGPLFSNKEQIMKTPFLFSLNFSPNSSSDK